jgi:hypothetical protein
MQMTFECCVGVGIIFQAPALSVCDRGGRTRRSVWVTASARNGANAMVDSHSSLTAQPRLDIDEVERLRRGSGQG